MKQHQNLYKKTLKEVSAYCTRLKKSEDITKKFEEALAKKAEQLTRKNEPSESQKLTRKNEFLRQIVQKSGTPAAFLQQNQDQEKLKEGIIDLYSQTLLPFVQTIKDKEEANIEKLQKITQANYDDLKKIMGQFSKGNAQLKSAVKKTRKELLLQLCKKDIEFNMPDVTPKVTQWYNEKLQWIQNFKDKKPEEKSHNELQTQTTEVAHQASQWQQELQYAIEEVKKRAHTVDNKFNFKEDDPTLDKQKKEITSYKEKIEQELQNLAKSIPQKAETKKRTNDTIVTDILIDPKPITTMTTSNPPSTQPYLSSSLLFPLTVIFFTCVIAYIQYIRSKEKDEVNKKSSKKGKSSRSKKKRKK